MGPPLRTRRSRGRPALALIPAPAEYRPSHPLPPRREGPRTPALCPGPSSPLAGSGSEGSTRVGSKPAPALGQTFQLARVPTTWEPRAPAGARSSSGPRADTYRLPGRVRARAPGVGGSFPKVHRREAGRVAWLGRGRGLSQGADPGAEGPAAARTKRCGSGLRCHSPPGQPPGAAVSPQDRPLGVKQGLCLCWTLHH